MNRSLSNAMFSIALGLASTGAMSQNSVYRCGSSYSQKPCADAQLLDVQDARTPDQKAQADATILRDTATGNAMEKERLAQENRQRTAQAKLTAAEKKQAASKSKKAAPPVGTTDSTTAKSKRKKSTAAKQKPTPEVFIASAPAEKSKPGARPAKSP